MVQRQPIVDFDLFDTTKEIASVEEIQALNHQRFEIQQLDAILFEDVESDRIVGVKRVSEEEFWVKGHMPGYPLMPGVIMCEAAAQLSSYFGVKNDLLGCDIIGLGGLESVRFRGSVKPGQELVLMIKGTKIRRRGMICCDFQGWVDRQLVVEGSLKGVPLFEASDVIKGAIAK